ncbi:small conductance calcium-activated potassium channel protein 3 [Trichinella spiralis]|uniref:small conductance calcium-activated potassium channel protein 3 n=1 Tax=Trichinella spiralis TaxID=6334 RepID=UPI0001EFB46C|nr:small conductance calcium-activated potassium channel protein 3 [Trichinella spiralis]
MTFGQRCINKVTFAFYVNGNDKNIRRRLFNIAKIVWDWTKLCAVDHSLPLLWCSRVSAGQSFPIASFKVSLKRQRQFLSIYDDDDDWSTEPYVDFVTTFSMRSSIILVNDSDAQDWRVAVTWQRIAQATLELVVCAVCPIPVSIPWSVLDKTHRKLLVTQVPLDTVLSMPMFFRFYLICRFMALRSRQFRDAATRSIAALNHISVNFTFVLKTLMHENPLRVLIIFTVFFWIIMAWILRQCEQFDTIEDQIKYMNSLWFIIITFMSIGYGDVTPHTYCGRTVAISTGIVRKHAAAAVLQHTWFIHKFRCLHFPRDEMKLRHHQKKFLAAITEFQRIKWEQRKVADESNALIDVAKLQSDMHEILFEMQRVQEFLVSKVDILMKQLDKLEKTLTTGTGSNNAVLVTAAASRREETLPGIV